MKNKEAAFCCKVHVRTLRSWFARYREGGYEGLRHKPVSGRPSKLTDAQKAELKAMVMGSPEALGYETGIWTAALIGEVVEKTLGVTYSVSHVQTLLKRLGCSFKMPEKNGWRRSGKAESLAGGSTARIEQARGSGKRRRDV